MAMFDSLALKVCSTAARTPTVVIAQSPFSESLRGWPGSCNRRAPKAFFAPEV
jgi:hypothetical protein